MTPIEKSRAEEYAHHVLKVKPRSTREEIRTAWRRKIVETHPDHNGGDDSQFQIVQAAYDVARGKSTKDAMTTLLDAAQLGKPVAVVENTTNPQRNPRRARIKTRMVFFDQQTDAQGLPKNSKKADALQLDDSALEHVERTVANNEGGSGDMLDVHTVQRVRQKGRRVTYIIWNAVKTGSNEVSLPKGDFRRPGESHEVDLQFAANAEGAATVTIPEAQRAAHFPGAQSVRVHFAHGADKRP